VIVLPSRKPEWVFPNFPAVDFSLPGPDMHKGDVV
jgi:hypothetical protein